MKRIVILFLCCCLVLVFTACGTTAQQEPSNNATNVEQEVPSTSGITEQTPADASNRSDTKEDPADTEDKANAALNAVMDEVRTEINLSEKLSFSAQTPFGERIDSSIFSDYQLTMINIWGTLCKPCIEEMSDIQKLYEDMASESVNVIGFVANYQDDRVEKAKEILTAKGITYSNVVFDDDTSGAIYAQVPGFPTTIFVDSEGNVVGDQVSGAHSYDEYKAIISERLEECTP